LVADTSSPDVAPEVLDQLVGEILKVPARVWREMFAELLDYDDRSQLRASQRPRCCYGAAPTA